MEAITFYSYKGGVGRSLALANTANNLARFGYNVCILDFDLEAPGIEFKFKQIIDEDIEDSIRQNGHINQTIKTEKGLVDYIYDYFYENTSVSLSEIAYELPENKEFFNEFVSQGKITIIGAGNINSNSYYKKLSLINWSAILYDEVNKGIEFFEELKEKIKNEIKPDFLLIDSRTGITEIGGICTSILADKIVYFTSYNDEGIQGLKTIYDITTKNLKLIYNKSIESIFVVSRIPLIEEIQAFYLKVEKSFEEVFLEKIELNYVHSNRFIEMGETLAARSKYSDIDTAQLAQDYLILFSKVLNQDTIEPKLNLIMKEILANMTINPEKVEREMEGFVEMFQNKASYEKLIDLYITRNKDIKTILNTYHDAWKITHDLDIKHLKYYVNLFLAYFSHYKRQFNAEIIISFIETSKTKSSDLEYILGRLYYYKQDYYNAEVIFKSLIENETYKIKSIASLFEVYNKSANRRAAVILFDNLEKIIIEDPILKNALIDYLVEIRDYDSIIKIMPNLTLEDFQLLVARDKHFAYKILNLRTTENKRDELTLEAKELIANEKNSMNVIENVGSIFYALRMHNEFRQLLFDTLENDKIDYLLRKLGRMEIEKGKDFSIFDEPFSSLDAI